MKNMKGSLLITAVACATLLNVQAAKEYDPTYPSLSWNLVDQWHFAGNEIQPPFDNDHEGNSWYIRPSKYTKVVKHLTNSGDTITTYTASISSDTGNSYLTTVKSPDGTTTSHTDPFTFSPEKYYQSCDIAWERTEQGILYVSERITTTVTTAFVIENHIWHAPSNSSNSSPGSERVCFTAWKGYYISMMCGGAVTTNFVHYPEKSDSYTKGPMDGTSYGISTANTPGSSWRIDWVFVGQKSTIN